MIDWRGVFKEYRRHVEASEGTDFLSGSWIDCSPFTDEERQEIRKVRQEDGSDY